MPEGDIRVLGADTHIDRKYLPVLLLGGAAVLYLSFRSRPAPSSTAPTVDQSLASNASANNSYALEFYQAQQQAAYEIMQLTAANALQQQQMNQSYQLAAGMTPGLLQQCISLTNWYALAADIRQSLQSQVANGTLYQTVGPGGSICFSPTQRGLAGAPPPAPVVG